MNDIKYFNPLISDSVESTTRTVLMDDNLCYDLVNFISSIPFRVNKPMLDFLKDNGVKLGLLQDGFHKDTVRLHEKGGSENKLSQELKKEIESYNSVYLLNKNIIGVAQLFENTKFYYPVYLDWRGRIYTKPQFLTFQGTEMAKSLIEFYNGKELSEQDNGFKYFLSYGASKYGLDKHSYEERIKWTINNENKILSIESSFLLKAKEPFLFISFCLEYKKYYDAKLNNKEFVTHLPILQDATCNGLQHLSMMISDETLAKNVNLFGSNDTDTPYDVYSNALEEIETNIKKIVDSNPNYGRLLNLKLDRKMIKKSIITISYSITVRGIYEQLEEFFDYSYENKSHIYRLKTDKSVLITSKDLQQLSKIVYNSLFSMHPKLKDLFDYLVQMSELMNILNLPIIWVTPSGLEISQNYVQFESKRLSHTLYKKSPRFTLRYPTSLINKMKQKHGIVPNLVHSMDATNLALFVKNLRKYIKDITYTNCSIYTVHDCFATLATDAPLVNYLVRSSFLEIYSDNKFIENFHNNMLRNIDKTYLVEDNYVFLPNGEKLLIPNPPLKGKFSGLYDNIINAKYIIN